MNHDAEQEEIGLLQSVYLHNLWTACIPGDGRHRSLDDGSPAIRSVVDLCVVYVRCENNSVIA